METNKIKVIIQPQNKIKCDSSHLTHEGVKCGPFEKNLYFFVLNRTTVTFLLVHLSYSSGTYLDFFQVSSRDV